MSQAPQSSDLKHLAAPLWVIAAGVAAAGLYLGRDVLSPFALALFSWLVIEGMARSIRRRLPRAPIWAARTIAIFLTLLALFAFVALMRGAILDFASRAPDYLERLNVLIGRGFVHLGMADPPRASDLLTNGASLRVLEAAIGSVRAITADLVLVTIYVVFLFFSAPAFARKIDLLFPAGVERDRALAIGARIRSAMEQYIWVQTILSVITTALTYATLAAMGLDNAVFWSVVIFFLNYIPTIGSIAAAALPALFAAAQPEWPPYMWNEPALNAIAVLAGVSVWQFVIGNFVGPRLMGDLLNISALVVLLSLGVWGALWGMSGLFLSAPLAVLIMIALEQTRGGRWIAVLMSAEGDPAKGWTGDEQDRDGAAPSACGGKQ
jgi:predicted PurR-regulated permease PerM